LGELSRIHGVRSQCVGKEEKGNVFTRCIEGVEELCAEGEMFRCSGECKSASCTEGTKLDVYSVKGKRDGEQGRTVIINHHLFGILLTNPVAKGAVVQRDCNRLDFLADRPVLIVLIRGRGQIPLRPCQPFHSDKFSRGYKNLLGLPKRQPQNALVYKLTEDMETICPCTVLSSKQARN